MNNTIFISNFLWILLSFVMCQGSLKGASDLDLKKKLVTLGETLELHFSSDQGLRLSKKGIIHLYSLGQGVWQITGIKEGIVMVEQQESKGERYLIEVLDSPKKLSPEKPVLPAWICKTKDIVCDDNGLKIMGTAPDFNLWYRFRQFCKSLVGCHYEVRLLEEQKKSWMHRLSVQLGKSTLISGYEEDVFLVLGDCRRWGYDKLLKYVNDQTGQMQKDGYLVVQCIEDHFRDMYQLEIQMVRVEKLDLQSIAPISAQVSLHSPQDFAANLLKRIEHLIESHHAKVVAHPVVNVITGSPIKIVSGGEFAIEGRKNRHHDEEAGEGSLPSAEWKNTGLEVHLELNHMSTKKLILKYTSQIKMRTAAQSVSVQMLSGEIFLVPGEKVLLGKVDFDHESYHEKGGILSQLPLVGEYFKETYENGGRSEVYLWATLVPFKRSASDGR